MEIWLRVVSRALRAYSLRIVQNLSKTLWVLRLLG